MTAPEIAVAKKFIDNWIGANKEDFYKVSDEIWSFSELGLEEYRSSKALINLLSKNGFNVESGVAGIPTAFIATYGSGGPVLAFSAEYDALPGLSQSRTHATKNPIVDEAPGHGCGHNLLGVGSALAAAALKATALELGLKCTIKVIGSPAEEICVGKPFMARAGVFNDIDAVLDWHPGSSNCTDYAACNAYFSKRYHFVGKTAHGNSPWFGRSALDATLIMGNMIEHLREHITPGIPPFAANTINYSFPNVGPAFPVVVPDRASLWVVGRMVTYEELVNITDRIDKCAQGAALATETTFEIELISATHERIPNKTMAELVYRNLQSIGGPEFSKEEQTFAKQLQKSYNVAEVGLDSSVSPMHNGNDPVSDNAEYSWFCAVGMLHVATTPKGVSAHTWGNTASVGSSIGKKALDIVGKVNAGAAFELIANPAYLNKPRKR